MKNKPHMIEGFWWILPVSKKSVDFSSIKQYAVKNDFREKEELHITIIGSLARDVLVDYLSMQNEDGKKRIIESINNLMNTYDWDFEPTEFYHIKKAHEGVEKEAIIMTVRMKCLNDFYGAFNKLLKVDLPTQFPHITFYTKGPRSKEGYYGIPIPTQEAFQQSNPTKLLIVK